MSDPSNSSPNQRTSPRMDDGDSDDDMPALSSPVQLVPHRGRDRHTRTRARDGNESDSSMPSLQTVSSTSEEDDMSSESAWETDSDEESGDSDDDSHPSPQSSEARAERLRHSPPLGPEYVRIGDVRHTARSDHPPRAAGGAGNPSTLAEYIGLLQNPTNGTRQMTPLQVSVDALQRQLRALTENVTATLANANGLVIPDDLDILSEIGNLNFASLGFNMYSEVDDDPERAKTIMAKLEIVPKELVKRYEKLRRGVKDGNEDWERDVDGCAICRDAFYEDESEAQELVVGEVIVDEVVASSPIASKPPMSTTTGSSSHVPSHNQKDLAPSPSLDRPSGTSSTSSHGASPSADTSSNAAWDVHYPSSKSVGSQTTSVDDSLRILVFPCPGMHLFHAECLAPWLARKTTCPTCRYDVDPKSLTLCLDRFASRTSAAPPFADLNRLGGGPLSGQAPATHGLTVPQAYGQIFEGRITTDEDETGPENPDVNAPALFRTTSRSGEDYVTWLASMSQSNREPDTVRPLSETPVQSTTPPSGRRQQWKPPKGRDFKKWLDREERRRDGITVEAEDEEGDELESEDEAPSVPISPLTTLQQAQAGFDEVVRQVLAQAATRPPPPPPVPAIPPWEEGEFVGPNAGFAVPRRAMNVAPSPLRFQTTVDDDLDSEGETAASMSPPEDQTDRMRAILQEVMDRADEDEYFDPDEALWDDDDDDDDDEMPPLIPDSSGRRDSPSSLPPSTSNVAGLGAQDATHSDRADLPSSQGERDSGQSGQGRNLRTTTPSNPPADGDISQVASGRSHTPPVSHDVWTSQFRPVGHNHSESPTVTASSIFNAPGFPSASPAMLFPRRDEIAMDRILDFVWAASVQAHAGATQPAPPGARGSLDDVDD